ncbi:MAG: 3-oxoacyl-[acyl-carrier-protein] synthase III C-terminal domain-containing protein [Polyangia bacterium]
MNIGILGLGTYLPDHVRTNDWWPADDVAGWKKKRLNRMTRGAIPEGIPHTEGVLLTAAEMDRNAADPFDGGLERRVIGEHQSSCDMETLAGERALANAGLTGNDIDLLLLTSTAPDYLCASNAAPVHMRLGMRPDILALETNGACNGFMLQLQTADLILRSGRCKYALVIQSSPISRLMDKRDAHSVWYGDGATAMVLGPVSEGHGILSVVSRNDGSCIRALPACVENDANPWYEGGKLALRTLDPMTGRRMLLTSADLGKQVLTDCALQAGVTMKDVDFFACHQASAWFRTAAQKIIGLEHARTVDTFSWAGNMTGANVPLVLEVGVRENLIKDGDLVAMYAGGGGMTWSGALVRWGR